VKTRKETQNKGKSEGSGTRERTLYPKLNTKEGGSADSEEATKAPRKGKKKGKKEQGIPKCENKNGENGDGRLTHLHQRRKEKRENPSSILLLGSKRKKALRRYVKSIYQERAFSLFIQGDEASLWEAGEGLQDVCGTFPKKLQKRNRLYLMYEGARSR